MQNTQNSFDTLQDLKTFLRRAVPSNGDLLVGVCGYAGAGKTTLCRALSDCLPDKVTHFSCDRFSRYSFKEREKRIEAEVGSEDKSYEENPLHWYDWNAISEALTSLRTARQFTYKNAWNPSSGELDATYSLKLPENQSALVLCDGIFLLHSSVKEWFDITLCVDCAQTLRQSRAKARTKSLSRLSYMASLERTYVEPYFRDFSQRAEIVLPTALPL